MNENTIQKNTKAYNDLSIDIREYIDNNKNCDTLEVVDAFLDHDPVVIGYILDHLQDDDIIEGDLL